MTPAEKEAGKFLLLALLKERHPLPMPNEELKARFVALVREHGNVFKAVEHIKRKHRQ